VGAHAPHKSPREKSTYTTDLIAPTGKTGNPSSTPCITWIPIRQPTSYPTHPCRCQRVGIQIPPPPARIPLNTTHSFTMSARNENERREDARFTTGGGLDSAVGSISLVCMASG